MTDSRTCTNCGEDLNPEDVQCPRCGERQPHTDLLSNPTELFSDPPPGHADSPPGSDEKTELYAGPSPGSDERTELYVEPGKGADESAATSQESTVPPDEAYDGWAEVRRQLEDAVKGEFEILKELGAGGMAKVYMARDLALGRSVAIKVMAPGLLMGPGMIDRFRQEAVTIANLQHPNIVTIHTVRQAGNLHFFVMQLVEGGSLEDVLKRREPIPVFLTQVILYQLGVGLSFAHRRDVVHRDIKPANVLLDKEGNAILTDFGIAKVTTATNLTQTGATMGTPAYMSPEQCRAGELSGASDQYSLGIVAYEMLTGSPPFQGSQFEVMQAHTAKDPPPIRTLRPDCPPEVEAAVQRMLAKDPAHRFPTVAEAIEAIGGYLPGPRDPIRADLASLLRPGGAGTAPGSGAGVKPQRSASKGHRTPAEAVTAGGTEKTARARIPRSALWAAAGVVGLAAIGTAVISIRNPSDQAPPPVTAPSPTAAGITFTDLPQEVLVGGSVQVRASVVDSAGQPLLGMAVEWSSSDPSVAEVEGSSEDGLLTGIATGTATVLARSGNVEEGFQVVVSAPPVGELTVSAPARELLVGRNLTLRAILTDETGASVPDAQVSWRSSDPGVLEVDAETGVATGRALGRVRVTAAAGDQARSVDLTVTGRVQSISVRSPGGTLQAGATTVVRAAVTSQPSGYRGSDGIQWNSSAPSVASVSQAGGDSVVVLLQQAGEAVMTARVGEVQGSVTLQVAPAPPSVTLRLSRAAVSFEAMEGGASPEVQTVGVTVTGGATPSLGTASYGSRPGGWLQPALGEAAGQEIALSLRVDTRGLTAGTYVATLPVQAGTERRDVEVRLTLSINPATAPVEPNDAAAQEIVALLTEYANAINSKNVNRVREIFPALPQDAIDDLLRLPESDTYYLQLAPGSLRLGPRDRTLDADVMSGVLGRDNRGELVRVIYTFGRGQRGWYIVALRAGD